MGDYQTTATVRAFLWTGGPDQIEDPEWFNEAIRDGYARITNDVFDTLGVRFDTAGGDFVAVPGQYIVQDEHGYLYAYDPADFAARFSAASS